MLLLLYWHWESAWQWPSHPAVHSWLKVRGKCCGLTMPYLVVCFTYITSPKWCKMLNFNLTLFMTCFFFYYYSFSAMFWKKKVSTNWVISLILSQLLFFLIKNGINNTKAFDKKVLGKNIHKILIFFQSKSTFPDTSLFLTSKTLLCFVVFLNLKEHFRRKHLDKCFTAASIISCRFESSHDLQMCQKHSLWLDSDHASNCTD